MCGFTILHKGCMSRSGREANSVGIELEITKTDIINKTKNNLRYENNRFYPETH